MLRALPAIVRTAASISEAVRSAIFVLAISSACALVIFPTLSVCGLGEPFSNLAAFLISDFSSYINGEVITIDGGEWLKGAGQFNLLEDIPSEMWDMLEMMIKAKKNK